MGSSQNHAAVNSTKDAPVASLAPVDEGTDLSGSIFASAFMAGDAEITNVVQALSGSVSASAEMSGDGTIPCFPYPGLVGGVGGANVNFPINALDFATKCGEAAALPDHIWDFQESTDNEVLVDAIANKLLVPQRRFSPTLNYGVATAGLNGGARTAIRLTDNTAHEGFSADDTELCNFYNGSVAWVIMVKIPLNPSTRALVGYGNGTTAPNGPEYDSGFQGTLDSSGRVGGNIADGTLVVSNTLTVGDVCDDTWNMIGFAYKASANTFKQAHDAGDIHTRDVSSLTWIDMQAYLTIGSNLQPAFGGDITYLATFSGAAADAVHDNLVSVLQTFHTQAVV